MTRWLGAGKPWLPWFKQFDRWNTWIDTRQAEGSLWP
jgi:hypothetical protein